MKLQDDLRTVNYVAYKIDRPVKQLACRSAYFTLPQTVYLPFLYIYDLLTLPRKQYEKAGRLADLYPFMEKDDTLKNVELLPELLTQTETEGKLYTLIPAYGILTLTGDPDIIGTDAPLTLTEMLSLYDKMGGGRKPLRHRHVKKRLYRCNGVPEQHGLCGLGKQKLQL